MTNARSQSDTPGNPTRRTVYPHAPNFPPGLNIKPSDGSDPSLFVPSSRNDGNDGSDGETAAAAGLGEGLQVQQDVDTYGIGGKIWDAVSFLGYNPPIHVSLYIRDERLFRHRLYQHLGPSFPLCKQRHTRSPSTYVQKSIIHPSFSTHLAPYSLPLLPPHVLPTVVRDQLRYSK